MRYEKIEQHEKRKIGVPFFNFHFIFFVKSGFRIPIVQVVNGVNIHTCSSFGEALSEGLSIFSCFRVKFGAHPIMLCLVFNWKKRNFRIFLCGESI